MSEKLSDRNDSDVMVDSRTGGGYSLQIPGGPMGFLSSLSLWRHSEINEVLNALFVSKWSCMKQSVTLNPP